MSRFVTVIYCDDVRNEVGNKQSFMGIYNRALQVTAGRRLEHLRVGLWTSRATEPGNGQEQPGRPAEIRSGARYATTEKAFSAAFI